MTPDRRARTQYTICDDCGNSTLEHNKAVWTTDGASYCQTCRPMTADLRMWLTRLLIRAAMKTCIMGFCYDHLEAARKHEVPHDR